MPPSQRRYFTWRENDGGEIFFAVHSPVTKQDKTCNYNVILEGKICSGNDLPWRVSFYSIGLNDNFDMFGPDAEFKDFKRAKKHAIKCIKQAIREFHMGVKKDLTFSRRTRKEANAVT